MEQAWKRLTPPPKKNNREKREEILDLSIRIQEKYDKYECQVWAYISREY